MPGSTHRESPAGETPCEALPGALRELVEGGSPEAGAMLEKAWRIERDSRGASGLLGRDTALILAELRLDADTLAAGLLLPAAEQGTLTPTAVARNLAPGVADLLSGALRTGSLGQYRQPATGDAGGDGGVDAATQAGRARKLLVALAADVRVLLVRLAERLALVRRLRERPGPARVAVAAECLEVYAPLAGRLGIRQFKWELEDLSFRELDVQTYAHVAGRLDERRADRERYVSAVTRNLAGALRAQGIAAKVSGRPKHIYSIWRKMKAKSLSFDEVFDLRAVRVLVEDVAACYAALGIVHARWRYVPGEFDDYIATPKPNHYQSLHTAVLGPEGKIIEVQIRTHEMHRHAEFGIAAHWRYKEGEVRRGRAPDTRIAWLGSALDWHEGDANGDDFLDQFRSELFSDRVYVMTPRGRILDLPAGATALDFAYQIHSEVGHRCRGAKINGAMAPLTRPLASGDRVEILTARNGTPSRDWLNQHLGYLRTTRARARVRQWFRQQDRERNLAAGQELLSRELRRLGIEQAEREALLERFNYSRFEDLLAAIGAGEVTGGQIVSALQQQVPRPVREAAPRPPRSARRPQGGDVRISGVGDLLTHLARCCKPIPPEPITGFITRGRGVSIHRRDCANVLRLQAEETNRIIDVAWEERSDATYPAELRIEGRDRQGLLRDITTQIASDKVNVGAVRSRTGSAQEVVIEMRVDIVDLAQLSRLIDRVGRIPNVLGVHRTG